MYPLAHMGIPALIVTRFRRDVDLRLFLFALMLPDIIDKPLGHFVLTSLNNGRIISHTLLFLALLLLASVKSERMRWVAFGVAIHHGMDLMFLDPTTYLWPLFGPFPRTEFVPSDWVISVLSNRWYLLGEVLGGTSLLYLAHELGYLKSEHLLKRLKGAIKGGEREVVY
ncbi:MAG: hypothetical protein DRN35_05520 [Thermoplasmata archaeon]|nr:MAG: hypothetical protein DRN35_05520 [Thermoplasmata archaeon]